MIGAFLVRRRERAAATWLEDQRIAVLLGSTPLSRHADRDVIRSRRRLGRWDLLLDLWTARDRRRASRGSGNA